MNHDRCPNSMKPLAFGDEAGKYKRCCSLLAVITSGFPVFVEVKDEAYYCIARKSCRQRYLLWWLVALLISFLSALIRSLTPINPGSVISSPTFVKPFKSVWKFLRGADALRGDLWPQWSRPVVALTWDLYDTSTIPHGTCTIPHRRPHTLQLQTLPVHPSPRGEGKAEFRCQHQSFSRSNFPIYPPLST